MSPSPETEKIEAVAEQVFRRRKADDPREHFGRFVGSLVYGGVIMAAGIALRVFGLIGETTLVIFILAAGIVIKGESLVGGIRAWKKGNGHGE